MKDLVLFDPGPQTPQPLTDHQAEALEHVKQAGRDGITATELGRALGAPHMYARSTGHQLLQALKKKGWVKQTWHGYIAIDSPTGDDFGEIPF